MKITDFSRQASLTLRGWLWRSYLLLALLLTRRCLVILVFAALFPALSANAVNPPSNLHFVRLLTEQGFSVSSLEAIFQDDQGYMWFGGLDGLVQYDGYNFVTHRHKSGDVTSLSSNVVWDIYEDRSGQLWIATDGGLNRFDRDFGTFTRFTNDPNDPLSICSDLTRSITEDSDGSLWIATYAGLVKYDVKNQTFDCFQHDPDNPQTISSNGLRKVFVDRAGHIWIGNDSFGLNRMDAKTGIVKRYSYDAADAPAGTTHGSVLAIFEDQDGYLWIGTDGGGLNRLNPATDQFDYFRYSPDNPDGLSNDRVTDITSADADDNLWLATEGGLNFVNRETMTFTQYVHNPSQKSSLNSSVVRSLYVDANQDLWVGNFPTGVNFLDTSNMVFRTWRHDPNNANSLNHSSVLAIEEDAEGNLWLGTDGGGLNHFNRQTGNFTHYPHNPADPQSLSAPAVLTVERDHDDSLWIGTWGGGANHFDPKTKTNVVYKSNPQRADSLRNVNVWSIFRDQQNTLWLATTGGGLNRFNRESDSFKQYITQYPNDAPVYVFWNVYQDSFGQVWAGTGEGLGRYLPEEDQFKYYRNNPDDPESLSFNVVLDIAEDDQKNLWVATRGGGLNKFNRETEKFTRVTEQDGLHSDTLTFIEPDDRGNFWLGASNGLTRFTPATGEAIHYDEKNGLQGNQFNIGAALKLQSGEMVVAGTDGFTIFDPSALTVNNYIPPVAIVDFQIFNKPVAVSVEGSPLTQVISQTDSITLDHHQSVFSFSFVAMNYRNSEKNQFAYMLEGFEKDWNYVNSERRNATYTNLNAGTYTFKVKASNNQGLWNETGRSITLHILPPPWKTWWAYTIYAFIFIGLLFTLVYAQHKKILNERKISRYLEAKVEERTAELQYKHQELEQAYVQLEAISLSDPLTGLSNRRYLQKIIPMDIAKVQREYDNKLYNRPARQPSLDLTFFLLDVDFFKPVNDQHGHSAGDQLLVQMSELLTKVCRESDCLVRWGGEEFLIVSRFASREESPLMAERIRKTIEQHLFELGDGAALHKTCSIGYACYPFLCDNPGALSWEQVIDTADRALYAAKKSGRNRSVGLSATNITPKENLYQQITADIKVMIDKGELTVVSQHDDDLIWD